MPAGRQPHHDKSAVCGAFDPRQSAGASYSCVAALFVALAWDEPFAKVTVPQAFFDTRSPCILLLRPVLERVLFRQSAGRRRNTT